MANINADMNKISRNLQQIGIASSFGVDASGNTDLTVAVTSGNLVIHYIPAALLGPMGGVAENVSPYLGIGTASPGVLQIVPASANTLGTIFTDQNSLQVLKYVEDIGNDVQIMASNGTTQLAYIASNPDWKMMGQ